MQLLDLHMLYMICLLPDDPDAMTQLGLLIREGLIAGDASRLSLPLPQTLMSMPGKMWS